MTREAKRYRRSTMSSWIARSTCSKALSSSPSRSRSTKPSLNKPWPRTTEAAQRVASVKILGIETSCDETSAAVVEDGVKILSNVVSSQIELHRPYGGVVPELASRNHLQLIVGVVKEALEKAGTSITEMDAIAATYGPGLASALLL